MLPLVHGAPDWCRWVPYSSLQYVPACSGYSQPAPDPGAAVGCVSSCEWVPQGSWATTAGCQKCEELYGNPQAPGFQGDQCEHWCQWVSRPAWMYTSGCQTCAQQPTQARSFAANMAKMDESKTKSANGAPDWCRWVPYGSLQYVAACNANWGSAYQGSYCASWCIWVPSPSWIYTPDCRQCSPAYFSGATATGCSDWCQWVSRPAWQNTPECMRCSVDQGTEAPKFKELPSILP